VSGMRRPLILASASPRRREILSTLGIDVEVKPSDVDETSLLIEDDVDFVREAALTKLRNVLERTGEQGAFVLASDTIVCVDGRRLGKPEDDGEALAMLEQLAGRDHVVRTAIALGRVGEGPLDSRVVETRVWFRDASSEELARYVESGEGRDKAGAYGVQGLAGGFVTRLDGSYTNVVGLPAAEVVALLLEHGALAEWP
jgi:septum formation protein